jgi:chaperonin GroES
MISQIKPTGNYVLVTQMPDYYQSPGGVVFPNCYHPDDKRWLVLAVGPGRLLKSGQRVPIEVAPGQQVIANYNGGERFEVEDGLKRLMIDAKEIVAVIETVL